MFLFLLGTFFLIRWQNLVTKLRAEKLRGLPSSFSSLHASTSQFQPPNDWQAENGTALSFLGLLSGKKVGICHCCAACSVSHGGRRLLCPHCRRQCTSSGWSQAPLSGWGAVEKCGHGGGVWVCTAVPSPVSQQVGFPLSSLGMA